MVSSVGPSSVMDEDDPWLSHLKRLEISQAKVISETKPTVRGFGLLPYIKKKRLYDSFDPQPDDFTLESLLSTPDGCGNVPVRPRVNTTTTCCVDVSPGPSEISLPEKSKNKCEFRATTAIVPEDEFLGSAAEKDGEKECTKLECIDQPSSSRGSIPTCHVNDKELRASVISQSYLFAMKCKSRNWEIDQTSMVDSFLEKLRENVERHTRKIDELQAFSAKHPAKANVFAAKIFDSRPFLDLNRQNFSIDHLLNSISTYVPHSKETIPKKEFDVYVNALREKLKSKQEPILLPTASESLPSISENVAEENIPRSPDPEEVISPKNLTPLKQMEPLFSSTPIVKKTIAPPPLPSRRGRQRKSAGTDRKSSQDVFHGTLKTMDNYGFARKPTTSESGYPISKSLPIATRSDGGVFTSEGPPAAKRMRYNIDGIVEPVGNASLSPIVSRNSSPVFAGGGDEKTAVAFPEIPTPASPPASQKERSKSISNPCLYMREVSFREGTILDLKQPTFSFGVAPLASSSVSNPPVENRNRFGSSVKKVKVDYGDDPFIYSAANSISASTSIERYPAVRTHISNSEGQVEDPYNFFLGRREPLTLSKTGSNQISPKAAVFRSTFSSLHDRITCSLATFDNKKLRSLVEWKLIPLTHPGRKSLTSLPNGASPWDPRLAALVNRDQLIEALPSNGGSGEEEVVGRTKAVLSKNYRKNPIKCIAEKSVSSIRSQLAFKAYSRRSSYPETNLKLDAEIQLQWNKQRDYDPKEAELIKYNLLPKWGSANPHRTIFPFGKTDGLYWPVVQPYDAIDLTNIDDVTCADTKNQLVCLTELTYAAKQPLLCGRDDEYHFKRFMRAVEIDESSWGPGRFRNRIGYMRVFNNEPIEEARAKDLAQQEREALWIGRLVSAEVVSLNKTDDDRNFQQGFQPNSTNMGTHVDFNLSDMFSRKYMPLAKDSNSKMVPHISKGERGPLKVPKNWFEVPIVLYMPTSQRRDYLVDFTNFRNKLSRDYSPRAGESVAYSDLVKYHLSAIKAIFVHQVGDEQLGLKSILEDKIQEKADLRCAKIYSELQSSKISIENIKKLCELEDWEEEYWTIIWDNLTSIYRNAPPISQLQLDRYIAKAFESVAKVDQRSSYFTRFWQIVEREREISY